MRNRKLETRNFFMSKEKLSEEIRSFEGLWAGGYYEGDPLNPLAKSTYGNYGYISVLHATYLRCIKPYIKPETAALEIGPGRGAWTRTMLGAKEIWTLDALSAEYNQFFEYLNHPKNVKYFQVADFECNELPEKRFDYMFSFGCLCHISFEGVGEYAKNIFPKLKSGANCFWLVSDKKKYNDFVANQEKFDIWQGLAPKRKSLAPLKIVFETVSRATKPAFRKVDDFTDGQGHWYEAGTQRTGEMLEKIGYKVLDTDVGTSPRDPIMHFIKP
ncbi:MAG TPA: class I SAM-dependent methyltransferase [Pyrinomonadaceae bacterium]|nr:class I SAM-dependent methyltransferase [Pyrinomonadaceae bacterium]